MKQTQTADGRDYELRFVTIDEVTGTNRMYLIREGLYGQLGQGSPFADLIWESFGRGSVPPDAVFTGPERKQILRLLIDCASNPKTPYFPDDRNLARQALGTIGIEVEPVELPDNLTVTAESSTFDGPITAEAYAIGEMTVSTTAINALLDTEQVRLTADTVQVDLVAA